MPVTTVGTADAATTGAETIVVPIPTGTAIGDDVYIFINFKRADGTVTSVTTPSGYFLIATEATDINIRLYQHVYTATPPATVTITFGAVDVHCLARSVTKRGFLDNNGSSWRHIASSTGTPVVSSPKKLSQRTTEFDGTNIFTLYATTGDTFYGAVGASITVPAEQTSLFSAIQTGPPDLGIAAGDQFVTTARTVVDEQDVVLSGTTIIAVIQLILVPAESTSLYAVHWDTPLGPYNDGFAAGKIIFDTTGDYAYGIGSTESIREIVLRKIVRSTFTLATTATLTGHVISDYLSAAQDATHLYVGLENSPWSYVKVQKSDLTVVDTGDAAVTTSGNGPSTLHLGITGTWSEGILWGICFDDSEALQYRLVGWNASTGAVAHHVGIPETTIGGFVQFGWINLTVDSNGDLWLLGMVDAADFPYTGTLTKVTSGATIGTPVHFNDLFPNDAQEGASLTYDAANHALIITTSSVLRARPEWGHIARYDITAATMMYNKNYGGLAGAGATAIDIEGNGLREFSGVPSLFTGWWDSSFDFWPPTIVQFNHETGLPIREFEMQDGYDVPHNIVQSPEGCVWMVSGRCAFAPVMYIHRICFGARGELSWIEMEMPPAAGGDQVLRPTYGRGYGKGYGDSHG